MRSSGIDLCVAIRTEQSQYGSERLVDSVPELKGNTPKGGKDEY